MNLDTPVANARQLYNLLKETATAMRNCRGIDEEDRQNELIANQLRNRVVSETVAILEQAGYPVEVTRQKDGITFPCKLVNMFAEYEYDEIIYSIEEYLVADGSKELTIPDYCYDEGDESRLAYGEWYATDLCSEVAI